MISDEYLGLLAGPDDLDGDLRSQLRELARELQQARSLLRPIVGSLSDKAWTGFLIFKTLDPLFNIAPFMKYDGSLDFEAIADWHTAQQNK